MKIFQWHIFRLIILVPTLLLGSGCSSIASRHENAESLASAADLQLKRIQAGGFYLTTYQRGISTSNRRLTVYLEGDGNAWDGKYRLSKDPTPKNPLGLKLAAKDTADAVLYIARPCMYLDEEQINNCDARYWSSHRYAEEVISSIDQAIDRLLGNRGGVEITLVGYSGGGTVAALVAARRSDVISLVTIAANLDHRAWTGLHKISPLTGSLNPINYAEKLSNIKQLHFLGEKDKIVPRSVIDSYVSRLGAGNRSGIHMIEGFNHSCCWEEAWPGLMRDLQPLTSRIR